MVEASTHYKKEQPVTLQNAIVHHMSEKINGGASLMHVALIIPTSTVQCWLPESARLWLS
jgi:hypothetical protein